MVFPKSAKAVVIGGGVLGTSAAFHLADSGESDIVLLERGPLACGTTPQAAGQTGYLNVDPFALDFGRYCIDFFERFEELTGHPIRFIQSGSLRVALTDKFQKDLVRRAEASRRFDDGVSFISAEDARKMAPSFVPPEACRILWIPRDGYVEPKSVAIAYAAAAKDRGAQLFTRAEVTGLQVRDGRVVGVDTDQGSIETEWAVLAAGAWTREFGHRFGLDIHAVPVRHQAFVTDPIGTVPSSQPIVRITEPQIYARPEAGGLLVGGYGYRPRSFDMTDFPQNFEIAALEADGVYYRQLREAATTFFPALHDAVVVQERRGLPTVSPDGRMIVAEPGGLRGLVILSACGVGGVDRSPGAGRVVADIVCDREPWIDAGRLSADRFGDDYPTDGEVRARCEQIYARHYHEVY